MVFFSSVLGFLVFSIGRVNLTGWITVHIVQNNRNAKQKAKGEARWEQCREQRAGWE